LLSEPRFAVRQSGFRFGNIHSLEMDAEWMTTRFPVAVQVDDTIVRVIFDEGTARPGTALGFRVVLTEISDIKILGSPGKPVAEVAR
jgi:hypothetical protein